MGKYVFKGVEAKQHGRRIIVGAIPAKILAELYEKQLLKVDAYSPANSEGYQRALSKTRSRKFGKFIADTLRGISPTSILIYSRDPDSGIKKIGEGLYEIQSLETDNVKLYITDGQHRTDGIFEAFKEGWLNEDADYEVPITILFWDPSRSPRDQRLEEAMQFYIINTQQKRMRTDLAHQYIFRQHEAEMGPIGDSTKLPYGVKKKDYVPYAIYIAKRLRVDQDSPWKDLILPPNMSGDAPITEGSFTDSLTPILDYSIQANLSMSEIISLLKNFWKAVFNLCPDARKNYNEYVLMKTSGVYSLHIFLPTLLIRKPNLGTKPSVQQFEQVLQAVGGCFTDGFWESKSGEAATFGTGKKSFQELATHIIEEIS
ncbi:MAG: DGQHR domain-containing protein [Nitrososphaerales archaeon]